MISNLLNDRELGLKISCAGYMYYTICKVHDQPLLIPGPVGSFNPTYIHVPVCRCVISSLTHPYFDPYMYFWDCNSKSWHRQRIYSPSTIQTVVWYFLRKEVLENDRKYRSRLRSYIYIRLYSVRCEDAYRVFPKPFRLKGNLRCVAIRKHTA